MFHYCSIEKAITIKFFSLYREGLFFQGRVMPCGKE